MKQFFIGLVLGASLTGTAFAVNVPQINPIADLPLQEQVNRLVFAVDKQFETISAQFMMAQTFFTDIDERLSVIEAKLKIKR